MTYGTASANYAERAHLLLKEGSDASLIYAALELRCGVEARLKEYIEKIDHIPKNKKMEWEIFKLGRSIDSAFNTGDKFMVFTFIMDNGDAELSLIYTPVSQRLQKIAKQLGAVLHAPAKPSESIQFEVDDLRKLLHEGVGLLRLATSGDLIGIPLIHKATGKLNLHALIMDNDPRRELVSRIIEGAKFVAQVRYIEPVGPITYYEN